MGMCGNGQQLIIASALTKTGGSITRGHFAVGRGPTIREASAKHIAVETLLISATTLLVSGFVPGSILLFSLIALLSGESAANKSVGM